MKYSADDESLKQHRIPTWYDDAKLGIFVHWGLYSVPAWAEPGEKPPILHNMDFAEMPYSEWYQNKLRIKGSSTRKHHHKTYGDNFLYEDFSDEFGNRTRNFDASEWAELFQRAGAKYSVLTTKHHDGYLLWPSRYKNPKKSSYFSPRDLVGEFVTKLRDRGLKTGLYYSGVLDWSFNNKPAGNYLSLIGSLRQSKEYIEYAVNHYYELIDMYKPDILWNDIGFPWGYDLTELFSYYYNNVPGGVINDRWTQSKIPRLLTNPITSMLINRIITNKLKKTRPEDLFISEPEGKIHTDFNTPEYTGFTKIMDKKFEATRGLGHSFAFNRIENQSHMLSGNELIHILADTVSKNGNLLINVGPEADGSIPAIQQKPLLELGKWLEINGEAIYETRPWKKAEDISPEGTQIRYTSRENNIYAIILGRLNSDCVTIADLAISPHTKATISGSSINLTYSSGGTTFFIPEHMKRIDNPVIKIEAAE